MITRKPKLQDVSLVKQKIDEYFTLRKQSEEVRELKNGDKRVYRTPPSILGLCNHLGISEDAFSDYVTQSSEAYDSEISGLLIQAKSRIAEELLNGVQQGYWNEKVSYAQLSKYGVLGEQSENVVKVVIQGSEDWSR